MKLKVVIHEAEEGYWAKVPAILGEKTCGS